MPVLNNKVPGDNFYPDYSRIKTFTALVDVTKGNLYTIQHGVTTSGKTGNNGQVTDWASTSSDTQRAASSTDYGNFETGLVQAMETVKAGNKVKCFMPGSRVGVYGTNNTTLVPGQLVRYNNANTVKGLSGVSTPSSTATNSAFIKECCGRIFEIYTKSTIGDEQFLATTTNGATAGEHILILEMGMR